MLLQTRIPAIFFLYDAISHMREDAVDILMHVQVQSGDGLTLSMGLSQWINWDSTE